VLYQLERCRETVRVSKTVYFFKKAFRDAKSPEDTHSIDKKVFWAMKTLCKAPRCSLPKGGMPKHGLLSQMALDSSQRVLQTYSSKLCLFQWLPEYNDSVGKPTF
jgi:hypothetical protein